MLGVNQAFTGRTGFVRVCFVFMYMQYRRIQTELRDSEEVLAAMKKEIEVYSVCETDPIEV